MGPVTDFKQRYEDKCRQLAVELVPAVTMLDEATCQHTLSLTHQTLGEKVDALPPFTPPPPHFHDQWKPLQVLVVSQSTGASWH